MRVSKLFILAAAVLLFLTAGSRAALIVNDNFDSYANQAAYDAAWPSASTVGNCVLSTTQAQSAPNSVLIGTTGTRSGQSFSEIGNPSATSKIVWSFDFFDTSAAAQPYRQSNNLQDTTAPTLTNQLLSMGLNNNLSSQMDGGNYYMARILGYTPTFLPPTSSTVTNPATSSGAYFHLNDVAAPLRSTGWHNLKLEVTANGAAQDYRFYVDNILSKSVFGVGTTLRSYDNIRIGAGLTSTTAANFDNMYLETGVALPEPVALGMLGMGSVLLLRRRRV
jgi:hypothetical protein